VLSVGQLVQAVTRYSAFSRCSQSTEPRYPAAPVSKTWGFIPYPFEEVIDLCLDHFRNSVGQELNLVGRTFFLLPAAMDSFPDLRQAQSAFLAFFDFLRNQEVLLSIMPLSSMGSQRHNHTVELFPQKRRVDFSFFSSSVT
jgi:hypothetical protein